VRIRIGVGDISMTDRKSQRIVLASSNAGKIREIQALLSQYRMEVVSQSALAIADADETGLSFVENAILKARHAAEQSGLMAIADDSGLAVDALNGAPGVRSARFAGETASDRMNIEYLLERLQDVPQPLRTARFHCVVVMLRHADDPLPLIGQGSWAGEILRTSRGQHGFGYDPVFYLPARQCTAAELDPSEKNRLSHRSRALQSLLAQWKQSLRAES
jgi:XTP/dITP diphosphohydrolase